MASPLSVEAIEALLSGLPHPELEDEGGLRLLVDDMARISSGPAPEPDPAVLGRFLGDRPATPSPATVVPLPMPTQIRRDPYPPAAPAEMPRRPEATVLPFRRRFKVGAIAGAAAALVASSVAVAGTTGSLPAPAQRVFVTVVEAITPFEVPGPDPAPTSPGPGADTEDGEPGTPTGAAEVPGARSTPPGIDQANQTPAGVNGTPGTPGPPASPGASGTAGPPESPGASDTAGPPASPGASGTAGPPDGPGQSGTAGPPENLGASGVAEPPASPGASGTAGPPESPGASGKTGAPRSAGASDTAGPPEGLGAPGDVGPPESLGTPAEPGPPTSAGASGAAGAKPDRGRPS